MAFKIVTGGQTGSDRAALDVAIKYNISYGGWCPKDRLAELGGFIPCKYLLQETDSDDFNVRTKHNIRDSDGTLIFVPKLPLTVTDGTVLTIEEARIQNKAYFIFDLSHPPESILIVEWMKQNDIHTLNVAGPRESQSPGIGSQTYLAFEKIVQHLLHN